jgi:hypothetical protein
MTTFYEAVNTGRFVTKISLTTKAHSIIITPFKNRFLSAFAGHGHNGKVFPTDQPIVPEGATAKGNIDFISWRGLQG